jgi:hypothetical protein
LADVLLRCRLNGHHDFELLNQFPKSAHLPNTRLETFFFVVSNIDEYMALQKIRGYRFITANAVIGEQFLFTQTPPSAFTGNSFGFIQWTGERGNYRTRGSVELHWEFPKAARPYLKNIGMLDHAATRVRAGHRDAAILEMMDWTNYNFDFAIYVEKLNSITNVARMPGSEFALVFTSGIKAFAEQESAGPTEQFVQRYGPRVHHLAWRTQHIDETYQALRDDGLRFLSGLVGGPEEGLKQVFTESSPNTLLVFEYIHRYGDFDGFFTRSNVAQLTEATARQ